MIASQILHKKKKDPLVFPPSLLPVPWKELLKALRPLGLLPISGTQPRA